MIEAEIEERHSETGVALFFCLGSPENCTGKEDMAVFL